MYVLVLFFGLAAVYTLINVILVACHNYRAHKFFKLKAPNLPVSPNPNIFAGQVLWQDKSYQILDDLHSQYGPTFGYYVCEQPWVSTTDIDLVKLIEVDQAHKHTDRPDFGLPFTDLNHSILQVNGEKWRQLRGAIAPAFTNIKVRSDEVTSDIESILAQLDEGIVHSMRKSPRTRRCKEVFETDVNGCQSAEAGADEEESMIMHVDDMFQHWRSSF